MIRARQSIYKMMRGQHLEFSTQSKLTVSKKWQAYIIPNLYIIDDISLEKCSLSYDLDFVNFH